MQYERDNQDSCRKQYGKVLQFLVSGKRYGVSIDCLREIIPLRPITRVPRAPDFLMGVIAYRGNIVPVIDLLFLVTGKRIRKNDASSPATTCILVTETIINSTTELTGCIAERILGLDYCSGRDIDDSSRTTSTASLPHGCIARIDNGEDGSGILLDIARLLHK